MSKRFIIYFTLFGLSNAVVIEVLKTKLINFIGCCYFDNK